MSDSHQAIYDAVRSRISNGDIGYAVESAMNNMNISHYFDQACETIKSIAYQYERPSVLFRPKLSLDGSHWCALYGDDLQSGVVGFGESPALAMSDFDDQWYKKNQGN